MALTTLQLYGSVGFFDLTDLIYLIKETENLSDLRGKCRLNEILRFQRLARLLEIYFDEVLEEIAKIPILPPIDHSSNKKSGRLAKGNRPDSYFKVGNTT